MRLYQVVADEKYDNAAIFDQIDQARLWIKRYADHTKSKEELKILLDSENEFCAIAGLFDEREFRIRIIETETGKIPETWGF